MWERGLEKKGSVLKLGIDEGVLCRTIQDSLRRSRGSKGHLQQKWRRAFPRFWGSWGREGTEPFRCDLGATANWPNTQERATAWVNGHHRGSVSEPALMRHVPDETGRSWGKEGMAIKP